MPFSRRVRRLAFGLATLAGRPRGFFIPYRYAAGADAPGRDAYPEIGALFEAARPRLAACLAALEAHAEAFARIGSAPPPAPRWTQDWFPTLDAAVLYHMVATLCPPRLVEVGSGHSTRFAVAAVTDGALATRVTAIDPAPRADIAALPLTLHRLTVQQVADAPFAALRAGDILSIDSSHILMPGTDVDRLFSRVLPALPAGVTVHIHDIFLPDGYPEDWAWRGYNEQNAVAALLAGGGWDVLWASHYAATRMAAEVAESIVGRLPRAAGARPASLWLRKR
ncbi:MAG: class I SAM-dependent methyltransferase [Alphaproteobacteria bacterium]|nr:class I SAM-dependent methyltransferase [Alphaproteobacteria bacterium]MDX5368587.1 class I SAM-dependent methyltransferase [Alphaproteobacteria bacterium]MDX5463332.1 class I SAM-dependent methyltransferase [Alphaproteobacteria bacterium]